MKKVALLSFALLASIGLPCLAQAQDINYPSNGVIGFSPGQGITPPVDPNNPDPDLPVKPVNPDPNDPVKPGTPGPLSLDFASSFDFGTNPISTQDQTYLAKAQVYSDSSAATPNYVQVTDNRGTGAGWVLSVIEEGQFTQANAGANAVLRGASISLVNATPATEGTAIAPSAQDAIDIVPDSETLIARAEVGAGVSTWVIRWGNADELTTKEGTEGTWSPSVRLFVPGSTVKDAASYSTTLNWALSELPNN